MNRKERISETERLMLKRRWEGWDAESARKSAKEAIKKGESLLEFLSFQALAEQILAPIHTSTWIRNRGKSKHSDGHDVIKRLLDAGAAPKDLAIFARMMQREYLSNLSCILDGAGIFPAPDVPFEDFRIFAVDESEKPTAKLDTLHEQLWVEDPKNEMKLSREAGELWKC